MTKALESEGLKGEAGRIGAGAGVGAIIGGILGGAKGAIAGILIGGSGVLVATEGKDVDLPVGTVLRVRFDSRSATRTHTLSAEAAEPGALQVARAQNVLRATHSRNSESLTT